MTKTVLG